jgi:hypothetical protein
MLLSDQREMRGINYKQRRKQGKYEPCQKLRTKGDGGRRRRGRAVGVHTLVEEILSQGIGGAVGVQRSRQILECRGELRSRWGDGSSPSAVWSRVRSGRPPARRRRQSPRWLHSRPSRRRRLFEPLQGHRDTLQRRADLLPAGRSAHAT